jgi:hypothetical protein
MSDLERLPSYTTSVNDAPPAYTQHDTTPSRATIPTIDTNNGNEYYSEWYSDDEVVASNSTSRSSTQGTYHTKTRGERVRDAFGELNIPGSWKEQGMKLSEYDIIGLYDDSTSTQEYSDLYRGDRRITIFEEEQDCAEKVVRIGSRMDEDGMDIYFLNKPSVHTNICSPTEVQNCFNFEPCGMTPLSSRLTEIMNMYNDKDKHLILIITDGIPTDEDGRYTESSIQEFIGVLRNRDSEKFKIVILLCTDDDAVVSIYNDIDSMIDGISVIDDFETEKRKCENIQRDGFVYTEDMHTFRTLMSGISDSFDKLNEMRIFCDRFGNYIEPNDLHNHQYVYNHQKELVYKNRHGEYYYNSDIVEHKKFYDNFGNIISGDSAYYPKNAKRGVFSRRR